MTRLFVYTVLAVLMLGSAMLATAGAFALLRGGDTLWLTLIFAFNVCLSGALAREYARA